MATAIVGESPPLQHMLTNSLRSQQYILKTAYFNISKIVGRSSPDFCHIFLTRPESDFLSLPVVVPVSRRDKGEISEAPDWRELMRDAMFAADIPRCARWSLQQPQSNFRQVRAISASDMSPAT